MRSVLVQLALGFLALFALAGFLLEPPANSQAGANEPASSLRPAYTEEALWRGSPVPQLAFRDCPDDLRGCLHEALKGSETEAALDFFDANRSMLLAFAPGAPVALGRVQAWDGRDAGPVLAFLNGAQGFVWVDQALRSAFEVTPEHPERGLSQDHRYSALLKALSPMPFVQGYDPSPFASEEQRLESITVSLAGEEEIVLQVGIHRGCVNCGSGIAERYAFQFGADGRLLAVKLLGLCEGRAVPGAPGPDGRATVVQEFGGAQFFHMYGVDPCPAHSPL